MTNHDQLAAEAVQLQAEIEERQERLDQIKLELATSLQVGKHDFGPATVTVSPNRRLDAKKFQENFPITQWPSFYKTSPDTKAIRDEIGKNEYERYTIEGKPRVTFGAVK